MNVAVTGGAGFIGSNLVRQLKKRNFNVRVIDDLSTGLKSNLKEIEVDFMEMSITNESDLRKALSDIDVIVHLAARGSVPRSVKEPVSTHLVNTLGTLNILEICRSEGKHLIFSSSSSVYGSNLALPKDEKMWMQPLSPYAASKLSAEAFVNAYANTYGIKTTPLRFFNVFGPRQRPDHEYAAVLPKWIWKALHGDAIEIFGDGSQTRDFTYVKTVCDVITTAIENEIYDTEFTNLAYGNNISLLKVVDMLKEEFPNLVVKHLPERMGDVKDSQNYPRKITNQYPLVSPVPFENAFNETLKWLSELSRK